ncbi:MAG: hypothetical protein KA314_20720 [Chloroflexi bacterium]|nr:hypothetical protein [Chloroflexota bacterium]MBP8058262.1 hypothetical protein [Chloroflexota bacterium]
MSRWFWGGLIIAFCLGWFLGRGEWTWLMVVSAAALLVCGRVFYHLSRRYRQNGATLATERTRLATLIAELSEGVLVCDEAGTILLHNPLAQQLLQFSAPAPPELSVFALLDEKVLRHGLNNLAHRREQSEPNPATQFITAAANGQLLRTRLIPLHGPTHDNGFILLLNNITQQDQASRQRDELLRLLTEGVRASLANIRAAIETIEMFSDMDAEKLAQLRHVIYEEALTLSTRLNQITRDHEAVLKANWHLDTMPAAHLLWTIEQYLGEKMGITVRSEKPEAELWLKADSYAIVQAMAYLAEQVRAKEQTLSVLIRLKQMGRLAALDFVWPGNGVEMDSLWSWQREGFMVYAGERPLTLEEVAERHGGEVWCQVDNLTATTYFRLLLPIL